jgi:hypothetical protein
MSNSAKDVIERVQDQAHILGWDIAETNVQLVLAQGVKLVVNRLPRDLRSALNKAVKESRLGHFKKDGAKPECYFRPESEFRAKEIRYQKECQAKQAVAAFFSN